MVERSVCDGFFSVFIRYLHRVDRGGDRQCSNTFKPIQQIPADSSTVRSRHSDSAAVAGYSPCAVNPAVSVRARMHKSRVRLWDSVTQCVRGFFRDPALAHSGALGSEAGSPCARPAHTVISHSGASSVSCSTQSFVCAAQCFSVYSVIRLGLHSGACARSYVQQSKENPHYAGLPSVWLVHCVQLSVTDRHSVPVPATVPRPRCRANCADLYLL